MKLKLVLIGIAILEVFVVANAGPCASGDDDAVKETIQVFLEGMKSKDLERVMNVVHPEARWVYVSRGSKVGYVSEKENENQLKKLQKAVRANKFSSPPSTERVVAVDVTGDIASAKVEIENPFLITTQYLSLIKFGRDWKIINVTVFHKRK